MQGMVNSPILFNIYNSDILKLFGLNSEPKKRAIAFADDLIVYCAGISTKEVQTLLETIVNKIVKYYTQWFLKVSGPKSINILFRKCIDSYSKKKQSELERLLYNYI